MIHYRIKSGDAVWLGAKEELLVTEIIAEIVVKKNCRIYAYNICKDHVHIIIECCINNLSNIIRLMKGKSAQNYKESLGIDASVKFNLWSQKFNRWLIESEDQFNKSVKYIISNRQKHGLVQSKGLQPLVLKMIDGCGNIDHVERYKEEICSLDA